jgi:hypothetical protein
LPSCSCSKLFSAKNLCITFGNSIFYKKKRTHQFLYCSHFQVEKYRFTVMEHSISVLINSKNWSTVKKGPSISKYVVQLMYTKKDC